MVLALASHWRRVAIPCACLLVLGACETTLGLNVPFESLPGRHGVMQLKTAQRDDKKVPA